jgi:hexosaminidase
MIKPVIFLLFLIPVCLEAQPFRLAPPPIAMEAGSPFFTDSVGLALRFDLAGAVIRYTLDGTLPNPQSPVFSKRLVVRNSCVLKAVAMHPDFLASEPSSVQLVRLNQDFMPQEATIAMPPSPKYAGSGAATLHDYGKGHAQLDSGRWLGFEGTDMDYTMKFGKKIAPKSLMVSILSAPGSWVMPPCRMELWASSGKRGAFKKVSTLEIPPVQEGEKGIEEKIYFLNFDSVKARRWRVVAIHGTLPEWHPAKDKSAWLFVDEVGLL